MSKKPNLIKLAELKCKPCTSATPPLIEEQIDALIQQLDGWLRQDKTISKSFKFKNYYQTISFVNAIAWICNQQDHHPELAVSYNQCSVEFTTHAMNGLSENDFICAARIDALITV